jgi:nicotinamide mononucleotide transporter
VEELLQIITQLNFNWSVIESIAVFFSILYVVLAVKENIWCWGAAAISVILYIYICYSAQLYAETGLQFFYLLMTIYGYFQWNKNDSNLKIQQWTTAKHLLILILGALLTFLMGFYFSIYTNAAMPLVDSFTTVFSVFATFMVTKKILGNWLYWIVIDGVSVYLYFSRGLQLTSLLFIVYTIIAIFGYLSWLKRNNEIA